MPSESCWKLLCRCEHHCVDPGMKTAYFAHTEGVVLEMVSHGELAIDAIATVKPKASTDASRAFG
jgi:hypothetical protein